MREEESQQTVAAAAIALNSTLALNPEEISGHIIRRDGLPWYEIEGADRMEPFLMTLASDSDHWLFISSSGGMTAGRINPDNALFPYYTEDKLEELAGSAGSRCVIRIQSSDEATTCWQPLTKESAWDESVKRTIRKNLYGNHIELEEYHRNSGLTYRVSWRPSGTFGFVRQVEILNSGQSTVNLDLLDGLVNLLPPGLNQRFVNEFSNLANAYKQGEIDTADGLALYHLSSIPTDLAEPSEALLASVAWQTGLDNPVTLMTEVQLESFHSSGAINPEFQLKGRKGAYLCQSSFSLEPGESKTWYMCADIGLDAAQVELLKSRLKEDGSLAQSIESDCLQTQNRLQWMLKEADGLQYTGDPFRNMRHTSNTLFNLMRGGAFLTGYEFPTSDLQKTVASFNRESVNSLKSLLDAKGSLNCNDPWREDLSSTVNDLNLVRLLREYLPLSFSRRHGDPSRPWNRFSIEIKEADGSPRYYYQGNWRDIFQNWETLLHSYPEYSEAAICRFLNATTADGYNPYRLTKDGFDWEVLDPSDPWANIGYWGDHQIIYLLRLLEASVKFHPGRLAGLLKEQSFVYAEVPYRIRAYDQILEDPRETVDYDHEWEKRILKRVERMGADGKLAHTKDEKLVRVSLMEKLLTPLVAKLSNFIPDAGIWMNTQRPEWNDANNALVGNGVSVVTLAYIVRYVKFLVREFGESLESQKFSLSAELTDLINSQSMVFSDEPGAISDKDRRHMMDSLGKPASTYRQNCYNNGLSGAQREVDGLLILAYLGNALSHAKYCLKRNKRADDLWHSYNLVKLSDNSASIDYLNPMLEGQVAVLSADVLNPDEAIRLLEALRNSELYRADQNSYILYPNKNLPGFLEKNRVPAQGAEEIPLLKQMLDSGDTRIIKRLPSGDVAFNGKFRNEKDLKNALGKLAASGEAEKEFSDIVNLFETTFNHHSFMGRSGTFFAYEGLGSIYWHMVSKLSLAVQENYLASLANSADEASNKLLAIFRDVCDGIGVHKHPAVYGAFPTDAYSHTPAHKGAQQPGMTGQVKEDILTRLSEMGISVADGQIHFSHEMIDTNEFINQPTQFNLPASQTDTVTIDLAARSLLFCFCGLPVIYKLDGERDSVRLTTRTGESKVIEGRSIPADLSSEIFRRSGELSQIEVTFS